MIFIIYRLTVFDSYNMLLYALTEKHSLHCTQCLHSSSFCSVASTGEFESPVQTGSVTSRSLKRICMNCSGRLSKFMHNNGQTNITLIIRTGLTTLILVGLNCVRRFHLLPFMPTPSRCWCLLQLTSSFSAPAFPIIQLQLHLGFFFSSESKFS